MRFGAGFLRYALGTATRKQPLLTMNSRTVQDRSEGVLVQVSVGIEWWPGAGSNRRPIDFQGQRRPGADSALTGSDGLMES